MTSELCCKIERGVTFLLIRNLNSSGYVQFNVFFCDIVQLCVAVCLLCNVLSIFSCIVLCLLVMNVLLP
jgi:hypothetical protein